MMGFFLADWSSKDFVDGRKIPFVESMAGFYRVKNVLHEHMEGLTLPRTWVYRIGLDLQQM